MVDTKKRELIEELKQLRQQKEITLQQIADLTEENGEAVSISTIKQVFGNSQHNHDYNKVLRPIMNVLMPSSDEDGLEVRILQTRLQLKDEIIDQLQERIEKKEQRHKDREEFLMEQLGFYKEQICFKDSQIKRLNEAIDRKDEMIRRRLLGEE